MSKANKSDQNKRPPKGYQLPSKHTDSDQPRFSATYNAMSFFNSIYNWVHEADLEEPEFRPNSRVRDAWLQRFVLKEPTLLGVLHSVVCIDKNRGWSLVGGRNQVLKYTNILRNMQATPDQIGWRESVSFASQAFWTTHMGAVMELGRDQGGNLASIYNTDPSRCMLTGNVDYPLKYYPTNGKVQGWSLMDYYRVSSLPYTNELYMGLGIPAVSRCLEIAKLMIAVREHDKEQLGARAPRGLLLLHGISQRQWEKALESRTEVEESLGMKYFGSVAVLASMGANLDAKLIALSQLPIGFELRTFMDVMMFGYALSFGYDPSEFWPVQYGGLGRGQEGTLQHEKATGKGRLDFVLDFQEQLQKELPMSIEFLFDRRDEQGELAHAQIAHEWATFAQIMYTSGISQGAPLITRDQTRYLMGEAGVIPRVWAPVSEVEATDEKDAERNEEIDALGISDAEEQDPAINDPTIVDPSAPAAKTTSQTTGDPTAGTTGKKQKKTIVTPSDTPTKRVVAENMMRDLLMASPRIQRACDLFPNEPIVRYDYNENSLFTLASSGAELIRRRLYPTH